MTVKIYDGYGHMHDLVIYGHILKQPVSTSKKLTNNFVVNTLNMVRLFLIEPMPGIKLQLQWRNQVFETTSEEDGFFKFEWTSETPTPAGWHPVMVNAFNNNKDLSLIHISEPTRLLSISYAVFCLKKKKKKINFFFFNDTATTEIYTRSLVGSVRCV